VTVRQHVEHVLLAAGVGLELLCCVGVLVVRDVFDRLHYAMAATTLGPILIATAIVVHESVKQPGINAILVAALLFLLSPVVATATARAARARRLGRIEASDEETRRGS
jgi:monovalent cation/proton antiporter MnhG/PhaG subunit